MKRTLTRHFVASLIAFLPCAMALAQTSPDAAPATQATPAVNLDKALKGENTWYASFGLSRQQYANTDIHVSQPGEGNDFTLHNVAGSDQPGSNQEIFDSLSSLGLTGPQYNFRVGKYMNPEKTFAIEFSVDHSKYNVDFGQTVAATGTLGNAPITPNLTITPQNFDYALHNGLNHIMLNAVWLRHLAGPEKAPGDLQLISRVGAGILLPHADAILFGKANGVGPKSENICCFNKNDWWQLNGWTAGVEVGLRFTVYKSVFLELTSKWAYGELKGVPVYQGSADHKVVMTEQVLTTGFEF